MQITDRKLHGYGERMLKNPVLHLQLPSDVDVFTIVNVEYE